MASDRADGRVPAPVGAPFHFMGQVIVAILKPHYIVTRPSTRLARLPGTALVDFPRPVRLCFRRTTDEPHSMAHVAAIRESAIGDAEW